jgi:hypothetical protein
VQVDPDRRRGEPGLFRDLRAGQPLDEAEDERLAVGLWKRADRGERLGRLGRRVRTAARGEIGRQLAGELARSQVIDGPVARDLRWPSSLPGIASCEETSATCVPGANGHNCRGWRDP